MSDGTQDSALICCGQEAVMARLVSCPLDNHKFMMNGPQNSVEYSTSAMHGHMSNYTYLSYLGFLYIFFLVVQDNM